MTERSSQKVVGKPGRLPDGLAVGLGGGGRRAPAGVGGARGEEQ